VVSDCVLFDRAFGDCRRRAAFQINHFKEASMPSRLMWFRILNSADQASYRKWTRVVAAFYATAVIGVVAVVALSSARQPAADGPLLASAKLH
jgi:hypothetical protein